MKFALVFVHLIMRYILGYLILGHPWSVSDLSIPCPNLSCSARCSPRLKKQPESAKCSSNSALNFLRNAPLAFHSKFICPCLASMEVQGFGCASAAAKAATKGPGLRELPWRGANNRFRVKEQEQDRRFYDFEVSSRRQVLETPLALVMASTSS